MQTPKLRRKNRQRMAVVFTNLLSQVCRDLSISTCDKNYILRRFHAEGVEFVTKTLPLYSKWVLECIETGVLQKAPTNFRYTSKSASPKFLTGLAKAAIESEDSHALYCIRQICEYCYKLAIPAKPIQETNAFASYVQRQDSVRNYRAEERWVELMSKSSCQLYPFLYEDAPHTMFAEGRPRNGSGSFYEYGEMLKEMGLDPASLPANAAKLLPSAVVGTCEEDVKEYSGFFKSFKRSGSVTTERVVITPTSTLCRIAFVPKDSRGPRVISLEALNKLRGQMAFHHYVRERLSACTQGRIQFLDQTKNQRLARLASVNRENATLDLKDASDRVSYSLVKRVFEFSPIMRFAISKLRSSHWEYRDNHRGLTFYGNLYSFANMGSGLCFPTLAMVVHLSATCGVKHHLPDQPLGVISKRIHVYGDDLICPVEWFDYVKFGLEKSGLLLNVRKSFVSGFFRESCGGDYYHGGDATPVRLKLSSGGAIVKQGVLLPALEENSASFYMQLERHARVLVSRDMLNTAEYIYSVLECRFGPLPDIHPDSPYFGRVGDCQRGKTVKTASRPIPVKVTVDDVDQLKGYAQALSRKSASEAESPFEEFDIPRTVRIVRTPLESATQYQYGLPDFKVGNSVRIDMTARHPEVSRNNLPIMQRALMLSCLHDAERIEL